VLELLGTRSLAPTQTLSYAVNLVIRRLPLRCAIGFPTRRERAGRSSKNRQRARTLFITPWQNNSIIGTWHDRFDGSPQEFRVTEEMIQAFIDEVNSSYPVINLKRDDIYHIHLGFLPIDVSRGQDGEITLLRKSEVHDHASSDGTENLITVIGVKYTAARQVAQNAVDLVLHKLSRPLVKSQTAKTPLHGGEIDRFDDFLAQALAQHHPDLSKQSLIHLVYSYGSSYPDILNYATEDPGLIETITADSPVIKAEIIHTMRQEMAQTLADVACRRTPLGAVGLPNQRSLQACVSVIAAELGWDRDRCEQEIADVGSHYALTNHELQRVA
jgi:glycerol-3-phosphate dehydrogenase